MAGLNLRDNLSFSKKSDSRDGFIETVYIINISLSLLLSGMYHNEFLVWLPEIIKIENRYSYNTLAAHQYYTTAARYYGAPHSTTVELLARYLVLVELGVFLLHTVRPRSEIFFPEASIFEPYITSKRIEVFTPVLRITGGSSTPTDRSYDHGKTFYSWYSITHLMGNISSIIMNFRWIERLFI